MKVDFIRKIGYSFLGQLAGNGAMLIVLLLIATLPFLPVFANIRQVWNLHFQVALGVFVLSGIVSMLGWTVVGLPPALLLRAGFAARLHWLLASVIGAVLGMLTMVVIFFAFDRGPLNAASLGNTTMLQIDVAYFSSAMLIAGVAFAVYCASVRPALRSRQ